jgi:hypothetical protein
MRINTKIVMSLSAVLLGVPGLLFIFLPQEIATYLGWLDTNPILYQLLGSLYFSFALVNWTAKANLIGGIYGKPLALGNFTHFSVGALTLIKWVLRDTAPLVWVVIWVLYSIFALVFGYILFTHPKSNSKANTVTHIG